MKKSSWAALIVALLCIAGGIGFRVLTSVPDPTPEQAIAQTLQDAEEAARRGQVSGVMEAVSDDFQAGPWNKARLRLILSRSLAQGRGTDYDVRINAPRILSSPKNRPDERVVISKMSAFYSGSGDDIWGSGPLTLVMRKESRPRLWVLREPRWRIVSVANVPPIPDFGADSL